MRVLLAALLLHVAAAAWASAPVALTAGVESVDLWPHVTTLADPQRALEPEQALAAHGRFAPPRGAYATLGLEREVVWLRVPFEVRPGGEGQWILDIDYALLQRVDAFVAREGRIVAGFRLGAGLSRGERPLAARSHAAALELEPGAGELLLRVDTRGARIVPLSLSRLSAFHARALHEQTLQGALAALGFVLLVYSLAQWASLREALYLKYAFLVLCSTTFVMHFFGIGDMYVWTDREWPARALAGVSALLAAAATALFIEDALEEDLHPWLRRALFAIAALHVAAAIAHGAGWIDLRVVGVLMNTTGLAPALLGLPGALAKARRGDSVGAWFIVAWAGYFLASAVMVGVVRGHVGANFWTLHSFQIGATLDMLIFIRIAVLRSAMRHREAQRAARERDQLHSLAHSDPLTGLLNRRGLDESLPRAIARATPARPLALYVLDLDGFKPVNDRHGHDVGDALLKVVAQRLRGSVRSGDEVARLGGDEFVVVAEGMPGEAQARELGMKILEAFASPFAVGGVACRVGATVGYALSPPDATDAGRLLKAADAAMYAGKQAGKNRLMRLSGSAAAA